MNLIRPYGDRRDDGMVQLAFTLPVDPGPKAREAALILMKQMGFSVAQVSSMQPAGEGFSAFVAYGRGDFSVDFDAIKVPEVERPSHDFAELNELILQGLGRRIVVLGACIGSDAHTTGIDAIFNMKGYSGNPGLERYPGFDALNLGAQVEPLALVQEAVERKADAILVSQIVTQRDIHKENARTLVEGLKAASLYGKLILVFGGPRIDHRTALELGFDAGFGPGTLPGEVANYLYHELKTRQRGR